MRDVEKISLFLSLSLPYISPPPLTSVFFSLYLFLDIN